VASVMVEPGDLVAVVRRLRRVGARLRAAHGRRLDQIDSRVGR
jgi:hypothetical protein